MPTAVHTPGYGHVAAGASSNTGSVSYQELEGVAKQIVRSGRGIYASDETPEGLAARFNQFKGANGTPSDEAALLERRRAWRECLYSAGDDLSQHISGIIMFSETLVDFASKDGKSSLAELITSRGILPGVRVDTDSQPLSLLSPDEPATQGLDDLFVRCQKYRSLGARFTKWRAPFLMNSSGTKPSQAAIETQAHGLARFASFSQQAGLVPIVEPDIDFGEDVSLEKSLDVHVEVISAIYRELVKQKVHLEGTLLKPSMVQAGVKSAARSTPKEVALATVTALRRSVPPAVPGIVFLSGGLSDSDAVAFLNEMNVLKSQNPTAYPWALTFSYGRALQGKAMELYAGGKEKEAQQAFLERAGWCASASVGKLQLPA